MMALQALFEVDSVGHDAEAVLLRLVAETPLSTEAQSFMKELVAGVLQHQSRIDPLIRAYAPSFPLEQIALVDRNILRLAIYEILVNNKVPVKVAINEAVELAKTFGSESSTRFINGVLGAVSTYSGRVSDPGSGGE